MIRTDRDCGPDLTSSQDDVEVPARVSPHQLLRDVVTELRVGAVIRHLLVVVPTSVGNVSEGSGRAGVSDPVGGDHPGGLPGGLGPGHDGVHVVLRLQLSLALLHPGGPGEPDGPVGPLHPAQVGRDGAGRVRHGAVHTVGPGESQVGKLLEGEDGLFPTSQSGLLTLGYPG